MPYVLKINDDANFQKMSQWLGVSYNQLQRVTEIILCINNSEFFQKFSSFNNIKVSNVHENKTPRFVLLQWVTQLESWIELIV